MRPKELADDYAGTAAVVKHAVEWILTHDRPVETVCCIYATAPFLAQTDYLKQGYERLVRSDKSYAFSVTTFPFPIQRAIRITEDGGVDLIWSEHRETRSQDLEEAYHDAGQFYWGTAEAFLNDEPILSNAAIPIVLPRYLVQDIDTLEDWRRAELMFQVLIDAGEIRV